MWGLGIYQIIHRLMESPVCGRHSTSLCDPGYAQIAHEISQDLTRLSCGPPWSWMRGSRRAGRQAPSTLQLVFRVKGGAEVD